MRLEKSLRIGVHHADGVVWEPVYRTHLATAFPRIAIRRASSSIASKTTSAQRSNAVASLRFANRLATFFMTPFNRRVSSHASTQVAKAAATARPAIFCAARRNVSLDRRSSDVAAFHVSNAAAVARPRKRARVFAIAPRMRARSATRSCHVANADASPRF